MSDSALLRVDCGSDRDWTAPDGTRWCADRPATGTEAERRLEPGDWRRIGGSGATREPDLPLQPSSHAGLLRCECFGLEAYRIGLAPGRYAVELIVGETHETLDTHQRRYALNVNGRRPAVDICPAAIAQGHARAGRLWLDGIVVADDGELRLDFGPGACCSGLAVHPATSDTFGVRSEALAAHTLAPLPRCPRRASMLFVGHSGTFFHGIPQTLQRMLASHPESAQRVELGIESELHGGKDCRFFAESPAVAAAMAAAERDYIVIQDSSWGPIEHPEIFAQFMPQLIERVRAHGAKPLLYAYSGPRRHSDAQRAELQQRYAQLGATHDVPVVPCAEALRVAMERWPELRFHNPDDHHLGLRGGWLFACVWYRALTGRSAREQSARSLLGGHLELPEHITEPLIAIADEVCAAAPVGAQPILAG